ncbi:MAG: hypothetical protein HYS70_06255 [Nitrospinae bacterium]|nr:hypothetical protein [Nitrospinota bacterium]
MLGRDFEIRQLLDILTRRRQNNHILTRTLLPEISRELLARMAAGETISRVHVSVDDGGAFQYDIS